MTRATLHLPTVLALLLSGAAATGFADARVLAEWSATALVSTSASIDAPAARVGPAVLPPAPASTAAPRDANTGPTGRMGPNDRPGDSGPAGRDGLSGQYTARSDRPIASARSVYRDHYAADALTRTGFPGRSATAPPAFHSD